MRDGHGVCGAGGAHMRLVVLTWGWRGWHSESGAQGSCRVVLRSGGSPKAGLSLAHFTPWASSYAIKSPKVKETLRQCAVLPFCLQTTVPVLPPLLASILRSLFVIFVFPT